MLWFAVVLMFHLYLFNNRGKVTVIAVKRGKFS